MYSLSGEIPSAMVNGLAEQQRAVPRIIDRMTEYVQRNHSFVSTASLYSGVAGLALAQAYRSKSGDEAAGTAATRAIELSMTAVEAIPSAFSLYEGAIGVAWVIQHLNNIGWLSGTDVLTGFDDEVIRGLSQDALPIGHDVVAGVAGIGLYGLERGIGGAKSTGNILSLVVERLLASMEETDYGYAWFSHPGTLSAGRRQLFPRGYYDLGVAHGTPGVIAVLARIHKAGLSQQSRLEEVIAGGVEFLRCFNGAGDCGFPAFVADRQPRGGRDAWCYGDPGVASCLWVCGEALDVAEWKRDAVTVALRAALRPAKSSHVVDASLCHGSAGLAHIFGRFYERTRDQVFHTASVAWLRRALGISEDIATAGKCRRTDLEIPGVTEDPFLLEGSAGVSLVTDGLLHSWPPDWDRALCLSA